MTRLPNHKAPREAARYGKPARRLNSLPSRPPAIEPSRASFVVPLLDGEEITPKCGTTNAQPLLPTNHPSTDLPLVVLRIPEVQSITVSAKLIDTPRPKKQRATLIAVATALVLLAALLFSGSDKKQASKSHEPVIQAPAWQTSDVPQHQPVPAWNEPVVALPPIETATPLPSNEAADGPQLPPNTGAQAYPETDWPAPSLVGHRYSDNRVANRGASLAEQARREAAAVARPPVGFKGTIEMQHLEPSHDGTRSSPY